jgi:hypothetical protein
LQDAGWAGLGKVWHFPGGAIRESLRRETCSIIDSKKYGYYLGKQFLCTFESTDHMLDMNHFERMIRERFQCP